LHIAILCSAPGDSALPQLRAPRQERFAQAQAKGLTQSAAYAEAGCKESRSGASAMAARPEVAKRIAELALQNERVRQCGLAETISGLMALAEKCAALTSAAAITEARLIRLEANRRANALAIEEARAALAADPLDEDISEAEWLRRYGAKDD
jgi:hypothetical protein